MNLIDAFAPLKERPRPVLLDRFSEVRNAHSEQVIVYSSTQAIRQELQRPLMVPQPMALHYAPINAITMTQRLFGTINPMILYSTIKSVYRFGPGGGE